MNLQLVYRYIFSLSKNENMFYEKTEKKTKGPKNRKQNFQSRRVEPRTSDVEGPRVIYCAMTSNIIDSR